MNPTHDVYIYPQPEREAAERKAKEDAAARDLFAAHALPLCVVRMAPTGYWSPTAPAPDIDVESTAALAYDVADAMMAERARRSSGGGQ